MALHHGVVAKSIDKLPGESSTLTKNRVIAYVDGFNVYYGLKNACRDADYFHLANGGKPSECMGRMLYWLDIRAVILSVLRSDERCVAIKYFSATRRVPQLVAVADVAPYIASNERQTIFLDALRTLEDLEVILGWYSEKTPHLCPECQHQWPAFEEKMTDVNIATHLLRDAYEDSCDHAIVMSADADLAPPIEAVQATGRTVTVVLPPGRRRADRLRKTADHTRNLKIRHLRDKMLANEIHRSGLPPLVRPTRWEKPSGWVWASPPPERMSA